MDRRPEHERRRGVPWLLAAVLAVSTQTAAAVPRYVCAEALASASKPAGAVPAPRAKAAAATPLSRVTALVVFTGFRGQQLGVPSWAESLFDLDRPGSVSHFYREMSFGSLTLRGSVAPRRYLASGEAADYAADSPTEFGRYWDFVEEILAQVDEDLDLASFDDDGPDGRPDSGDDDGRVDLVVVLTPRLPRNFIIGGATGIAPKLHQMAATSDPGFDGRPIGYADGVVAQGRTFAEAAGTVAHELGHALFGLPDLYGVPPVSDPAEDSGGIGNWGLMGWGALGWRGGDGPVSFSAWSRLQLGWARVTEVTSPSQRILVRDVAETGELVRIPTGVREYFLLEHRTRSSFYDRGIPAEGLLIWHISGDSTRGMVNTRWQVDLECADGRWAEAGFPAGRTPDPLHGGDNLDFWARDGGYASSHAGNLGDATDVFGADGRTAFTAVSNPSSADRDGWSTSSITDIERTDRGIEARVEISGPEIEFEVLTLRDQTGDSLLVAGEEAVVILDAVNRGGLSSPGATLTLEPVDGLLTLAPERLQLPGLVPDVRHPAGVLERPPRVLVAEEFASSRIAGLRLTAVAGADTIGRQVLGIPVISARQEGVQWRVRDWQGTDRLDPGDLFRLDLRLESTAPELLPALRFSLSSPGETVARVSDGFVGFEAEGRHGARSSRSPEFLALAGAAGTRLSFVLEVRTPFQVWTDTAAFAVTRQPDITPPRVERLRLSPGRDGLIVRVLRRHILEGSEVRRVSARIHDLPDSILVAELPMAAKDAAYQARWEGPAGTYSVTVEVEDAGGNIGRSEAASIEIGAAGTVEFGGPVPGVESGLAGDWRPVRPAATLESPLLEVDARGGGAWYGRTSGRLWRSQDEGATWHPTSFMLSGHDTWRYPSTVHADLDDPLTAYVIESGPGEVVIWATLDGGRTWAPVPMPEGALTAFVDGHLPGRLYAASDGAVLLSDDWGRTWTRFPVEGRAEMVRSHPADREKVYAWVPSDWGSDRLWRLDETGARDVGYVPVRYGPFPPVPDPWIPGGFHLPENRHEADSDFGPWVLVGTSLHHTSDEGNTWRVLDLDLGSEMRDLAASDSEPGLLYLLTEGSLFRSHDGGETWQETAVRFDQSRYESPRRVSTFGPSDLMIHTTSAAYVSRDRGETAVRLTVETPPPVGTVWFDDLKGLNTSPYEVFFQAPWDSEMLIVPRSSGYSWSTTGGESWEWVPLESVAGPRDVRPRPSIFADPWRSGVLYLANESLWQSSDRGESWERMGPYADLDSTSDGFGWPLVLPPLPAGALLASRDTLAVLYGDSLWVGHKDGRDWRVAGRLEPGGTGLDLVRHPDEPGLLYAAATTGCFVSADGGRTWRRVLEPRTGSWRTARLRGHPADADALYLAADRELYHSPDRGATWRALDPGYPGVPWFSDVAVDPSDPSTLYVATRAGLFTLRSRPTAVTAEAAVPRTTELMSSYPNPFNPSTVIPFRLGAAEWVRIDIYNLLGQRVRRLLDEPRAPGLHRISWSGTDDRGSPISSGVYFYRLTSAEVTETRRCMLVR